LWVLTLGQHLHPLDVGMALESHVEPRLTRLGYPVKSLCEALNARPAEIRAFLRGRLAPGRTQELHQELLKLGVVA
jgi:hypothetical protein